MRLYVDEQLDFDLATELAALPAARREHALGYLREHDRRLSVAVYRLLKRGLAADFGFRQVPEIAVDARGKPFFVAVRGLYFSFSHCERAAACAIAERPVGVDIEIIGEVDHDVARRVLSAAEYTRVMASAEREVEFARLWTMKEALLKCRGTGIDEVALKSVLSGVDSNRFELRVNREAGYQLAAIEL